MSGRVSQRHRRALLALLLLPAFAVLLSESGAPDVALGAGSVSFQDGMAEAGEPVAFHVSDQSLNSLGSGTATWTSLPEAVSQSASWNLATGAPHSSVHSLSGAFDPPSTPLAFDPLPTASVNGVAALVDDLNPASGSVSLLNDVDAGSTLVISFSFDKVDSYGAASQRVRVTTASDADGEWVGFSEVTSTTSSSPDATSGVFRGTITPSAAQAADASGDGKVWVQAGDSLTITYFGSGGSQHTDSVPVDVPTPHSHEYADHHTHAYANPDQYTDSDQHSHAHRHSDSDQHSHANRYTDSDQHPHANRYPYSDQHSHANRYTDSDQHSHANRYTDSDQHSHANRHSDSDQHSHANRHSDSDQHSHAHRHPYSDQHSHANRHSDSHANRHTHGDPHRHAHPNRYADGDHHRHAHRHNDSHRHACAHLHAHTWAHPRTHTRAGAGRHPNSCIETEQHTNGNTGEHCHAHADRYAHPDTDRRTHAEPYRHTHVLPYATASS